MNPNQWLIEIGVWALAFFTAMVGAFFEWLASLLPTTRRRAGSQHAPQATTPS